MGVVGEDVGAVGCVFGIVCVDAAGGAVVSEGTVVVDVAVAVDVVGCTDVVGSVVVGSEEVVAASVAVVPVVPVVCVIAAGVLVEVVLPSSFVSSSASRTPTRTASSPAAISAASGPRRRRRVVPQAGQKTASTATGAPQTGHGRTATGAPADGDVAIAAGRYRALSRGDGAGQAPVELTTKLAAYARVDVLHLAVDLVVDVDDALVDLVLDRRPRLRQRVEQHAEDERRLDEEQRGDRRDDAPPVGPPAPRAVRRRRGGDARAVRAQALGRGLRRGGRHGPTVAAAPNVDVMPAPSVWTIGYEKLLPGALVAELEAAGVQRLIDVRFRPQSRRAGMSKTRLGALLGEHGIAYKHRRALGTPPDLRQLYKSGHVAEGAAGFAVHIEGPEGAAALDTLAAELARDGGPRTALLCLEADPAVCHRRQLTDALARRLPGLRVVDL